MNAIRNKTREAVEEQFALTQLLPLHLKWIQQGMSKKQFFATPTATKESTSNTITRFPGKRKKSKTKNFAVNAVS